MTYPSKSCYTKTDKAVQWLDITLGCVYYRVNGTKPFVVVDRYSGGFLVSYLDYSAINVRLPFGTALYEAALNPEQETDEEGTQKMNTNTLYHILDTDKYCNYLATRSDGMLVVEIKGTSEVRTVHLGQLEEVLPFTFGVKFASGHVYHFLGEADTVSVGDLVLRTDGQYFGSFGVVDSVDTKSKQATKRFTGHVISVSKTLK